ncbi:nucleotidyltransferase domain-containing protein [Streptomyces flavotricini]|uniref:Nucleotidyltransferase domain-containing protein n=1 Tax=Streptomyces flavotricini TaxID=66888 RepID=A0ABS8E0I3_9ACTN|nr:nucleotidyltransferase domain-containing protein [Streptomyces flavotricini]MCC0094656.1 nucleotidyltransferase domain-containing protein [Streptomyces flavotricini]
MRRERATGLLQEMLDRLDAQERPLDLVDEVYVFGSYARGALEPGDVDVAVAHRTDAAFTEELVGALMSGRDPMATMKRALKGTKRGLQFQFNQNGSLPDGVELVLLWKRGDTPAAARARLEAITADPDAARAPRDEMIEQFEGLDRWIPLPVRAQVVTMLNAGAIGIQRIELPDTHPERPEAAVMLARRWKPDSPLRRAASAALRHAEILPTTSPVWVQGQPLQAGQSFELPGTMWINLGWYDFDQLPFRLRQGAQTLEVIRPTRTQPLHALHITVRDVAALPPL